MINILLHVNFGHPMIDANRELESSQRHMIDVPENSQVLDVASLLALQAAGLTFAVNGNIVGPDFVLSDGDRLSILRPMSGG
jgi:sulfur carrier protein ThiS